MSLRQRFSAWKQLRHQNLLEEPLSDAEKEMDKSRLLDVADLDRVVAVYASEARLKAAKRELEAKRASLRTFGKVVVVGGALAVATSILASRADAATSNSEGVGLPVFTGANPTTPSNPPPAGFLWYRADLHQVWASDGTTDSPVGFNIFAPGFILLNNPTVTQINSALSTIGTQAYGQLVTIGNVTFTSTITINTPLGHRFTWTHFGQITISGITMIQFGDVTHEVQGIRVWIEAINASSSAVAFKIVNCIQSHIDSDSASSDGTGEYSRFDALNTNGMLASDNLMDYTVLGGWSRAFHFVKGSESTPQFTQGTRCSGAVFGSGGSAVQYGILLDSGTNAGLGECDGTIDLFGGYAGSMDFTNNGTIGGGWTLKNKFIRAASCLLQAGDEITFSSLAGQWAKHVAVQVGFTGNGSTTNFSTAHGVATTPFGTTAAIYNVSASLGSFYVYWTRSLVGIVFAVAPPSGAFNVFFSVDRVGQI